MKASGLKYDRRAAKTAPVTTVDVLGAAGQIGVRDTERTLPDPSPPPPPPLGKAADDLVVDEDILSPKLRNVLTTY